MITVLISLMALVVYFVIFMGYRNYWVCRERNRVVMEEGLEEYYKLPSYNTMVFKFWIWDVEKFKK